MPPRVRGTLANLGGPEGVAALLSHRGCGQWDGCMDQCTYQTLIPSLFLISFLIWLGRSGFKHTVFQLPSRLSLPPIMLKHTRGDAGVTHPRFAGWHAIWGWGQPELQTWYYIWLCATTFDGADLSIPTEAAAALLRVWGKVSTCLRLSQQEPQTCAGRSTCMPTCLCLRTTFFIIPNPKPTISTTPAQEAGVLFQHSGGKKSGWSLKMIL